MSPRYQVGGALRPGALYLPRPTDAEAEAALLAGDAIHVLGPRQLGKSSLRLHLAARLREAGLRVAHLDLSGFGAPRDTDAWLSAISEELALELDDPSLETLTRPPPGASSARYLARLVESASAAGPWVLFLDEVDALIAHPETADALLGALRAAWDEAAAADGTRPLRLCLSGVVAPFELGADPNRTPFNISRPILLQDFSRAEIAALGDGFEPSDPALREALLDALHRWTEGHPYMSHRLAERIAAGDGEGPPEARVEALVRRLFLQGGTHGDANLAGAARRLAATPDDLPEMLALYRRCLVQGGVEADGRRAATVRLLLTGLVAWRATPEGPRLRVRNPIYAAVFDRAWVDEQLDRRPFAAAFEGWTRAGQAEDWLLRGEVLSAARAWATGRADLSQEEMGFLLRSADAWRAEEARRAELEQARLGAELASAQQARARLRARALGGLAALLAVVVVGLGLGVWRLGLANQEIEAGRERAATVAANLLAGQAVRSIQAAELSDAELNAAAALGLRPSPVARGVLLRTSGEPRPSLAWSRPLNESAWTPRVLAGGDRVLATSGADVVILRASDGAETGRIAGAAWFGWALSTDGEILYSATGDGDRPDRRALASAAPPQPLPALLDVLDGERGFCPVDFALDPGGRWLGLGSSDYNIGAFSLPDHRTLWTRPLWARRVHRLSPSPDGARMAIGVSDGSLEIVDPMTGAALARNEGAIGGLAFAWLDATSLVYGGRGEGTDGRIRIYADGRFVEADEARLGRPWGTSMDAPTDRASAVSGASDGQMAWLGLTDGTVIGFDRATRAPTIRFRAGEAMAFVGAAPGRLYTLADNVLRAWDLPPETTTATSPMPQDLLWLIAAFSRGPSGIWISIDPASVELRDPATGELREVVAAPTPFHKLVDTPQGLVLGGKDGSLLRRTPDGWVTLRPPGGPSYQGLVATPDGETLAAQGHIERSTVVRRGAVRNLPCSSTPDSVSLRPDGARVALGCTESLANDAEPVVVFDTDTGARIDQINPGFGRATATVWTADGAQLLVGLQSGQILRWIEGQGAVAWPGALSSMIIDLEITPDGRWIVGADTAGLVRVWDPQGALVAEVGPLLPGVSRLQLDDTHLSLRRSDGSVARWSLAVLTQPPEALESAARARWGRELRDGELGWVDGVGRGILAVSPD